jgi:hypothetical protein
MKSGLYGRNKCEAEQGIGKMASLEVPGYHRILFILQKK